MTGHSDRRKAAPKCLSIGMRVERACDEFEAEWKAGRRPRIEDYLKDTPQRDRWPLLRELLLLELDYRNRLEADGPNVEDPSVEDPAGGEIGSEPYEQRFPEFADLISHLFEQPRGGGPSLKRVRDYKLLEKIGEGGMGVVYKARHMRLGKIRALKVLPQYLLDNTEVLERFRLEVEHSGRLEHPNIVQALDAGEENGIHFLVMEFVDGRNLDELVKGHGPLTIGAACELIRQAAVGLEHANDLYLVHRDIKPSNLMLTRTGLVKILDLGLARVIAEHGAVSRITTPGGAMGTMDYMAPEQWEDASSVDIRADIYSLGCTLYYLLTAKVPYGGEQISSALKKHKAHREHPIPSLLEELDDAPKELQAVLERLMAKNPDDRYANPADVIDAVGQFAERKDLALLSVVEPGLADGAQAVTTPRFSTSFSETRKRHPQQKAKPPPWYRRRKFLAPMAAAAVTWVVALGLWFGLRGDPASEALRADLAAMPGMHGEWWFDETPWLAPGIRARIVESADLDGEQFGEPSLESLAREVHGSDVAALYGLLQGAANKLSEDESLPDAERRLIQELASRDPLNRPEKDYLSELASIAKRLQEIEDPTPTAMHLLAVTQHKLGQREEAEKSYREAIRAYEQTKLDVLRALCMSDYARMLIDWDNERAREAIPWCREARCGAAGGALRIVTLCLEAEAQRKNACLKAAESLIDQADDITGFPDDHPLKAHVAERRAWVQLDSWRFGDVLDSFADALEIRRQSRLTSDYTQTAKAILWIRQGMAMSNHFLGNKQLATEAYRSLLAEIPDAVEVRSQRQRSMSERGPNVYERLADCYLFGPDPSSEDYRAAAELLDQGIRQARFLGLTRNNKAPYVLRLYYKLQLVAALAGDPQAPEQYRDPQFDELASQLVGTRSEEVFATAKQVAAAISDLQSSEPQQRKRGAGALVAMIEQTQAEDGKITRHNIEFLLLAVEQLCQSQTLDPTELEMVAQQLIKFSNVADPQGQRDVLAYLRRYLASAQRELQRSLADQPNEHLSRELGVIEGRLR